MWDNLNEISVGIVKLITDVRKAAQNTRFAGVRSTNNSIKFCETYYKSCTSVYTKICDIVNNSLQYLGGEDSNAKLDRDLELNHNGLVEYVSSEFKTIMKFLHIYINLLGKIDKILVAKDDNAVALCKHSLIVHYNSYKQTN